MSISETDIYNIGEIAEWVEQRRKYEEDNSLERWRVMRTLATIMVNMMSKRQIKEQELFKLGDELPPPKTKEEMEAIEKVFEKWDKI